MISDTDKQQIILWNDRASDLRLLEVRRSPDSRSEKMVDFCNEVSALSPYISFSVKDNDSGLPFIEIGGRLRYQAVPQGKELELFLEALILAQNPPRLSDRINRLLEDIVIPASLTLFITLQCPHCPVLIRQLLPILFATDRLSLTIIDGLLFPEIAQMYGVKSVPNLFLGEDFQWKGMVGMEELLATIADRNPENLSLSTLVNLLQDGKASTLAEMMIRHGAVFPAFFNLVSHEKWPIRLGAMVTFEEIADRKKDVAADAVSGLIHQFEKADDQAKGDILYLIGLAGAHQSIPFLASIRDGRYDQEIREAAIEALETIRNGD